MSEKESEKVHRLAYRFLCALSDQLKKGTVHLRDKNGRLLQTLDEVVLAIKDGRWPACSRASLDPARSGIGEGVSDKKESTNEPRTA